ncbi:FAD-dependent oxidoreductase, partial [Kibdelosporangium lantanae]
AYVLAGELLAAGGDHRVAFPTYTEMFVKYSGITRKANAGPFMAPGSRLRIALRNWMFNNKLMLRMMLKMTDNIAEGVELKDYERETEACGR